MKVIKVQKADNINIYSVTLKPNWLGRLFGRKEKVINLKDTRRKYMLGGGGLYINKKGEELGVLSDIGKAIDNFKRSWE